MLIRTLETIGFYDQTVSFDTLVERLKKHDITFETGRVMYLVNSNLDAPVEYVEVLLNPPDNLTERRYFTEDTDLLELLVASDI